jgi:phosphate transport system permease protein
MVAVARGIGETAPILLTALGNEYINLDPRQPTDALPLRIYAYARTPIEALHVIAWGGAITLLIAVLGLSITARILSARQLKRLG